jgi:hypothetical protein
MFRDYAPVRVASSRTSARGLTGYSACCRGGLSVRRHGSPFEAHVRKDDGTEVEVLVNKDFEVTAVIEMGARP